MLQQPIQEYGSRNHRTLDAIYRLRASGYSAQEVQEAILEWYGKPQHVSRTLETAPQAAEAEVRAMVKSIYRKPWRPAGDTLMETVLRIKIDAAYATDLLHIVRQESGEEPLDWAGLRHMEWGFSFIQLASHNGKTRFPVAAQLMKLFHGASSRSYQQRRDYWKERGLFRVVAEGNHGRHRAGIYELLWPWKPPTRLCGSVEEGLLVLLPEADIRREFIPSIAASILTPAP